MALYFLVLDSEAFNSQIRPALAASWRSRSFAPCQPYCAQVLMAAREFGERYQLSSGEPLLAQVNAGLAFDRLLWHHLAGEFLWFGAAQIPELETNVQALTCLLAPQTREWDGVPRQELPPIIQAHRGSRDLVFGGGFYRPENAGWNELTDVQRLAAYLQSVRPENWQPADLAGLPDLPEDEREEELAFVRDWFPTLQALYEEASVARQIVVCEILE